MWLQLKIWVLITVYKYLHGYSKISTKLIFAQAKHETGNFTSDVFKENHNLFGMRQAKVRKNTATGTNRNHATYKNHRSSIIDYFLRQSNFKIPNVNDTDFMLKTVGSNYAEDKNYLSKWTTIYKNTVTPLALKVLMYGGLFFLVLIVSLMFRSIKKSK